MTRPLRILQVVQPRDGGAAEHVRLLCGHLVGRGHEVTVAGPPDSMLAPPGAGLPDCSFVPIPALRREPSLSDVSALWALRRLLAEHRWDVVHLHSSKAGFVGRVAAASIRTSAVVLYTPHCFAFLAQMSERKRSAYKIIERVLRGFGEGVILVSAWERDASLAAGVVAEERSWVIHNGADPFRGEAPRGVLGGQAGMRVDGLGLGRPKVPDPGVVQALAAVPRDDRGGFAAPLVGTVARLRPEKGATDFVRLAARVAAANEDAHFVLVGDGPQRDECERLAASLGVAERLHLVGFRSDVASFLSVFDVFALTSRQESFPLAVLEAMALGLPTVATLVGGVGEIVVPGVTGYLVPPGDVEGAAEAVVRLLSTPAELRTFGEAAHRRYLELFVPEIFAAQTLDLYQQLLGRRD
ncbi:MAG: glycosyltransferase [Thermoleophilia bacterium]